METVNHKNIIKTVPKLRFPGFVDKLISNRLKDISSIKSGLTPLRSTKEFYEGGTIPWVKTTDLNNSLIYKTEEYVTPMALQKTSLKLFPSGSVLIAMYGGFNQIGRTGLLKIEAATNQALSVITTNVELIPEYLLIWFNAKVHIWRKFAGSSRKDPNITSSDVASFPIIYPSLPEQKKIASFLSEVDRKIQQLTRKKELLEQYKKGVMQKIFSREIRFKDENGKDYPDWAEKRLGDILTFISTNSFSRNDLNYENGEIKNIHYGDIHTTFKMGFDVKKEKVPFINKEINLGNIDKKQFCQVGDIVVADASEDYKDIGKTIEIWNVENEKIVAGLHTFLSRDTSGQTVFGFKGYLLQVWQVRKQIMRMAQGISVLGISKKNLAKVKFQLPCTKEQTKTVAVLKSIDKKIDACVIQLTQTQQFKKGLLQQMFV